MILLLLLLSTPALVGRAARAAALPPIAAFVETGFPFDLALPLHSNDELQRIRSKHATADGADLTGELIDRWGGKKTRCAPGAEPHSETCLYDHAEDGYNFEDVEATSFLRWARSAVNCNVGPAAARAECAARADVVVVRSACATWLRSVLDGGSCNDRNPPGCTLESCGDDSLRKYWIRLHHHVDRTLASLGKRRGPPPLVLLHGYASWGNEFQAAVLRTLASLPAAFVARVTFVTIEEPWGRWPDYAKWFAARMTARPTFVVVPYSIHTANILKPAHEKVRRPFAALFQGRPRGSFDGARLKFLDMMMAAGGLCDRADWRALPDNGPTVVCVLCAAAERANCGALLNASLRDAMRGCPECQQPGSQTVSWGTCALGSMSLAAHATLCIEPTSDDLMRSHFYLGVQAGCVPVLFDGAGELDESGAPAAGSGGLTGTKREITPWAWRQPARLATFHSSADAAADALMRRANYSAFALPYFSADLMAGQLGGLADHLLALATLPGHAARLHALRRAVGHVASLMRWAPPTEPACDERAPCDAFSALVLSVRATRWAGTGISPALRRDRLVGSGAASFDSA